MLIVKNFFYHSLPNNIGGDFLLDLFNLIDTPYTLKTKGVGVVGLKGASIPQNIFKSHYLLTIKFIFLDIRPIILQVNHC